MVATAMNALLKIAQAGVQILTILTPRDPIYAGSRILMKAFIGLRQ
jgi:hypothetical protein